MKDEQWALIEPHFQRPDSRGAKPKHPIRLIVNAILYHNKTGCQWRLLPPDFPPWQTVYNHFWRMRERGVWESLNWTLNIRRREALQMEPTPKTLIIDSQSVKTNYEGEDRGFHGGKKIKGRSRQIVVDSQGQIWGVHVHAANLADTKEGCQLLDKVMGKLGSVTGCNADAGYRRTFVEHMREHWNIPVHISERIVDGFAVLPRRWVVERTFSWFNGQRRLSKDYEKTIQSSRAMIFIAAIARNLRSIIDIL